MDEQKKRECMIKKIGQTREIINALKEQEAKSYEQFFKCKETISDVENLSIVQIFLAKSKLLEKYFSGAKGSEAEAVDKIKSLRNQIETLLNNQIVISYLSGKKNLEELRLECAETTRLREKYESDLKKYVKEFLRHKRRNPQKDTQYFM